MKFLRNKKLIGLLCIALALFIVFLVAPAAASEQTKTTEVCMANQNIEEGTMITKDMLKTVRMPASIAPIDARIQSASVGKYATGLIWAGDVMTASKLSDTNVQEDTYALATAKGKMVVSVTVKNLSVMAAARLQPGDVVTIMALMDSINSDENANVDSTGIATTEETAEAEDAEPVDASTAETAEPAATVQVIDVTEIEPSVVMYPELKYMEIAAIVAKEGVNAKVNAELGEDEENDVPVTISFYATEEQAKRLAELEKNGTAYIAFVARSQEAFAFIPETEKVLLEKSE